MVNTGPRGHRERLRARFARAGLSSFHDYEVLELLLTFAVGRVDTKPIARRLLARAWGAAPRGQDR